MSITTTYLSHHIRHWDGPVMAITNSATNTVELDETPCATYTTRIVDTVAHLQHVMTVEMEI